MDENGAPVTKSYLIPFGQRLKVMEGDEVAKGALLTEGHAYPQDILAVQGPIATQNYLISEVQKVYRLQGVDINDKHIEVIVRQMMRKVRLEDSGSAARRAGYPQEERQIEGETAVDVMMPNVDCLSTTRILKVALSTPRCDAW